MLDDISFWSYVLGAALPATSSTWEISARADQKWRHLSVGLALVAFEVVCVLAGLIWGGLDGAFTGWFLAMVLTVNLGQFAILAAAWRELRVATWAMTVICGQLVLATFATGLWLHCAKTVGVLAAVWGWDWLWRWLEPRLPDLVERHTARVVGVACLVYPVHGAVLIGLSRSPELGIADRVTDGVAHVLFTPFPVVPVILGSVLALAAFVKSLDEPKERDVVLAAAAPVSLWLAGGLIIGNAYPSLQATAAWAMVSALFAGAALILGVARNAATPKSAVAA